ncbi:hypothetical protein WJX84_000068 [Apatococcus fuscideae]|uniref:Uncharacterized protein n=1 Tax=Apatococcus fuscideae TaxID=2026836 RepID=A0AAW1SRT1_9CHLO
MVSASIAIRCLVLSLSLLASRAAKSGCSSSVLQGRRSQLEDAARCGCSLWEAGLSLYSIFDGHEGGAASDFCSSHVLEAFASALERHNHDQAGPLKEAGMSSVLRSTIQSLDEGFLSRSQANESSGTTAVLAVIADKLLMVANVGDSQAFICPRVPSTGRPEPPAELLTTEHLPDSAGERRRITSAGGHVSRSGGRWRLQGELALSRAIGDAPYRQHGLTAEPSISPWRLLSSADDLLLLATDGLFETLSADDACSVAHAVMQGNDPQLQRRPVLAIPMGPVKPKAESLPGVIPKRPEEPPQSSSYWQSFASRMPSLPLIWDYNPLKGPAIIEAEQLADSDETPSAAEHSAPAGQSEVPHGSDSPAEEPVHRDAAVQRASGWYLGPQIGQGGFGGVWRAIRHARRASHEQPVSKEPQQQHHEHATTQRDVNDKLGFVLKRLASKQGPAAWLSGLREAHFGQRLLSLDQQQAAYMRAGTGGTSGPLDHLARFVESFQVDQELWLAFRDEGRSLHALMYTPLRLSPTGETSGDGPPSGQGSHTRGTAEKLAADVSERLQPDEPGINSEGDAEDPQMLVQSDWWWRLREMPHDAGIKHIILQACLALQTLHSLQITHRDVKLENLLVREQEMIGSTLPHLHVRLADLGSGLDVHSVQQLYGDSGPSDAEQTPEYSPPEVLLGQYWASEEQAPGIWERTWPYDMWSLGVIFLELILGTPHVFDISPRTRVLMQRELNLDGKPQEEQAMLYLLRGYMELCIYPPRPRQTFLKADATVAGQSTLDIHASSHSNQVDSSPPRAQPPQSDDDHIDSGI